MSSVPCSKSICLLKVSPLPSRGTYQPLSSTVKENVPFRVAHPSAFREGWGIEGASDLGLTPPKQSRSLRPDQLTSRSAGDAERLLRPVRAGKTNQGKSPSTRGATKSSPRHRNRPPLSGPTRPILLQNSYTGDCPARFIESAPHAVSISRRAALPIRRKSLAKSRI